MKINKNSWHYRFIKKIYEIHSPTDLCSYLGKFLNVLGFCFVFVGCLLVVGFMIYKEPLAFFMGCLTAIIVSGLAYFSVNIQKEYDLFSKIKQKLCPKIEIVDGNDNSKE